MIYRVLTRAVFLYIFRDLPARYYSRSFLFSTFRRAVAEGGGVRPLLRLLYLAYVLSFFLVTAYD